MLRSLRTRLLIGITPLLGVIVALGSWAVAMFYGLGGDIDVILRENYRSVLAMQSAKEAVERMDSAFLFAIGGQEARSRDQFNAYQSVFHENLEIESGNVTLPGERELADELLALQARYDDLAGTYFRMDPRDVQARTRFYFRELLPTFDLIKNRADRVLALNQANMEEMDRRARISATDSTRWMIAAVLGSFVVGVLIAAGLSRSILGPIRSVTDAARAIADGELDQVVPVVSRDELGQLAQSFNGMARQIRAFQQAGTARLLRAQKTAQATIDSFPDPVVVVDPAGAVERANPSACRLLGVVPIDGTSAAWASPPPLAAPLASVLRGEADYLPTSFEHTLSLRDAGQERHFLPRILSIRDDMGETLGAAVVLVDVTRFHLMDQLKSDMVATASHELKTPLTSIQMAVHLLLEEVVGPLTAKQTELLLAARQDSDRLLAMVNDLLDLARLEQGSVRLDLRPVAAEDLIREAIVRSSERAHAAGVRLEMQEGDPTARVLVDPERITHVFDNLIGNAIAHTPRGGHVVVEAELQGMSIRFRVRDDGEGIAEEHLPHLFERFYRVPTPRVASGAGLGLAIAREIVESHRGQISVASRPEQGATFTFSIPADGSPAHPEGGDGIEE